jgi:hypothetical protein
MADHPRYRGAPEETGGDAGLKPFTPRQRLARVLVIAIVTVLLLAIVILHITGTLGPGMNG